MVDLLAIQKSVHPSLNITSSATAYILDLLRTVEQQLARVDCTNYEELEQVLPRELAEHAARSMQDVVQPLYSVLEYLAAEILDLAGTAALDSKRTNITMFHVNYAVNKDHELRTLFKSSIPPPCLCKFPSGRYKVTLKDVKLALGNTECRTMVERLVLGIVQTVIVFFTNKDRECTEWLKSIDIPSNSTVVHKILCDKVVGIVLVGIKKHCKEEPVEYEHLVKAVMDNSMYNLLPLLVE